MKEKSDWVFIVLLGLALVSLTWCFSLFIGFKEGSKTARLYYEATGQFPSSGWLDVNLIKGYDSPDEILNNLKPY